MMNDERLAEIMGLTADVVAGRIHVRFDEETAWLAILDLRREVERLRQREAAMREIVEAVAGDHLHTWEAIDPQENWVCQTCGEYSQDYAEEMQSKAHALLASGEGEE